MKRALAILLLVSLFTIHTRAQNLVVDGGFEDYAPPGGGLLLEDFLPAWASYVTTPDYYSTVLWSTDGVLNYCGVLPRTGGGMVGGYELGYFSSSGYNREYIQGSLAQPLEAGRWYYAEVYVCPMLKPPVIEYAVKNLGIAFTDQHFSAFAQLDQMRIPETPEVTHGGAPVSPTGFWTRISGCFQATGGETKVIIGNFQTDAQTEVAFLPGGSHTDAFAYYLFDDLLVRPVDSVRITPDTAICEGSTTTLQASYPGALGYAWNTGVTGPTLSVATEGAYTVTVSTAEGCALQATSNVTVTNCTPPIPPVAPTPPPPPGNAVLPCPPLSIPSAFTPNADDVNDCFRILNPGGLVIEAVRVFDRWGGEVFAGEGRSCWDGRYKGEDCAMGVYYYLVRYRDCRSGEGKMWTGNVTLVR